MREGRGHLTKLAEAIQRIEGRQVDAAGGTGPGSPVADRCGSAGAPRYRSRSSATLWPPPTALACGLVHEWFAGPLPSDRKASAAEHRHADPPLCALLDLASRTVVKSRGKWAVWIGRWCWPYPSLLPSGEGGADALHHRSLFVDPPDRQAQLWAIEVAARSSAVATVVADGRGLNMAGSRRLQLAAQAGHAFVLLARSASERKAISAANARWRIAPTRSPNERPRWRIDLVRCKGVQRCYGTDAARPWLVEWDRAQSRVVTPAELADPAPAAPARPSQSRIA